MSTVQIDPQTRADTFAEALRQLAVLVEDNPELLDIYGFGYAFHNMLMPCGNKANVAAVVRAASRAGARAEKHFDGSYAGAVLHFGPISIQPYAGRDEMCERIVTGTREVTETVPDPEMVKGVPLVEVTRVEDIVEWRCSPLLDDAIGGES